ncbi:hypothetical protein [Methylobacterium sp. Leaf466]|uniref:hypothetical protein n=1 Tax=Methylobacterium sp. Leaf466 TaxID=1736386 RepID=UPI000B25EBD5|nr:hypothetical protein [Methylobacterium sp. Leaf466]
MKTAFRFLRRYLKPCVLLLWIIYMTYAVVSGKIEAATVFEKLTSSEIVTLIIGVW